MFIASRNSDIRYALHEPSKLWCSIIIYAIIVAAVFVLIVALFVTSRLYSFRLISLNSRTFVVIQHKCSSLKNIRLFSRSENTRDCPGNVIHLSNNHVDIIRAQNYISFSKNVQSAMCGPVTSQTQSISGPRSVAVPVEKINARRALRVSRQTRPRLVLVRAKRPPSPLGQRTPMLAINFDILSPILASPRDARHNDP